MDVTRDAEPNADSTLRPGGRDTIYELLDPVLPEDPCTNLLRRDRGGHRGGHWQVSQLLRLQAPGLTLSKATLVDHETTLPNIRSSHPARFGHSGEHPSRPECVDRSADPLSGGPMCSRYARPGQGSVHQWHPFSEARFKTRKYLTTSRILRQHPRRATVLRWILRRVQRRPPPLRDRTAHTGVAPLRHRHRHRRRQLGRATINAVYAARSVRSTRRPTSPRIPEQSWINQPQPELQNT